MKGSNTQSFALFKSLWSVRLKWKLRIFRFFFILMKTAFYSVHTRSVFSPKKMIRPVKLFMGHPWYIRYYKGYWLTKPMTSYQHHPFCLENFKNNILVFQRCRKISVVDHKAIHNDRKMFILLVLLAWLFSNLVAKCHIKAKISTFRLESLVSIRGQSLWKVYINNLKPLFPPRCLYGIVFLH